MSNLSFGNPSVGVGALAQTCDLTQPSGYCYPGGGDVSSDGFDWAGLVAAITASGNAAATIIRANSYPYPYGNPYSIYGGGLNTGMVNAYQTGGYGGLQAYQTQYGAGQFTLGGTTGMILIIGLAMVMMVSLRR